MAVECGFAAKYASVKGALQFFLAGQRLLGEGRSDGGESLAVETMHREVDAEALLDAVDKLLVEGDADIGNGDTLSVAHDGRHRKNAEGVPAGFDADDGFSGLVRLHHGIAPGRDIFAELAWSVGPVESRGGRRVEAEQRDALRLEGLERRFQQRLECSAIALGDGVSNRRQVGDDGADRQPRATFIIEGRNHAVIL